MKLGKTIMVFFSVALLAGIVLYINPMIIAETIAKCNVYYIIGAFALANIALFLRIMKWKVLLDNITLLDVANIQIFGIAVSNLTPGKIGDPVKSLALKMLRGIPVSSSLSSVIWERIFDVTAMLIFGIAGLYLISSIKYFFLVELSIALFSILLIFLMSVLVSKKIGKKVFGALRIFPIVNRISDQFISNFYSRSISKKSFISCFILTMTAWFCDGMVFYLILVSISGESFNLSMPIIITSMLSLSILAGLLSSLPGGAGSTEAIFILMLGAIGISTSVAASVTLLGRALTFYYSIAMGYFSFIWLGKRINTREILKEIGF